MTAANASAATTMLGGGYPGTLNLRSNLTFDSENAPQPIACSMILTAEIDGSINTSDSVGVVTGSTFLAAEYNDANPNNKIGPLTWLRWTNTTGTINVGTAGSWQQISVARQFGVSVSGFVTTTKTAIGTIDFSLDGGSTTVLTATNISVTATTTP